MPVPSSRPLFKTQFRHYTHRTPMHPSEHKLALGNTTNSDYTPTVLSFLPHPPIPHPIPQPGSTRAQHRTLPLVQVLALAPAHISRWPSRLTTISHRICSQITRYYPTILSQTAHSGIQASSAVWEKPRIGCCCSALYLAFSQSSRTFSPLFFFFFLCRKT
jgi:hypothetical protein